MLVRAKKGGRNHSYVLYPDFLEFFDKFESGRNYFSTISLNELAIDYQVGKGQIDLDLFIKDLVAAAIKRPVHFHVKGAAPTGIQHGELKTGLGNNDNAVIVKEIVGSGRAQFENTLMPNFSATGG